jgi:hypothetical protein
MPSEQSPSSCRLVYEAFGIQFLDDYLMETAKRYLESWIFQKLKSTPVPANN